jgi:hypothetical protein
MLRIILGIICGFFGVFVLDFFDPDLFNPSESIIKEFKKTYPFFESYEDAKIVGFIK